MHRVSNRNFVQRFTYVSSKNYMKFRYNFALMLKSYFAQIIKKILVFAHFVIPAISLFRAISLNFEKQFQEMNESKIKPIRAPSYTPARSPLTHTFGGGLSSKVLRKTPFNFKTIWYSRHRKVTIHPNKRNVYISLYRFIHR